MASILDRLISVLPKSWGAQLERALATIATFGPKQSSRRDMVIKDLDMNPSDIVTAQPSSFNVLEKLQNASTPRVVPFPPALGALNARGQILLKEIKTVATVENAKKLQFSILTLQNDLVALREQYTRKFEKNEIPSELYLFYLEQLDTTDHILEFHLENLVEHFKLQSRRLEIIVSQNNPSSTEFSKKLEALEILFHAVQRESTSEDDRLEFFKNGLAILKKLDAIPLAQTESLDSHESLQGKLSWLRIEFKTLQRRADSNLPLVTHTAESSISIHPNKAKTLTLIDGLAYAATRLEASTSENERKVYYKYGREILNEINSLKTQQQDYWRLTAEEASQENTLTLRFRNAIPRRFGLMSIVRSIQEENSLIAIELKKINSQTEQLTELNERVKKQQAAIAKTRRRFHDLVDRNLLAPQLNDLYQHQLDEIAAELLRSQIALQGKFSLRMQALASPLGQNSTATEFLMNPNEFMKKLECLEILFRAATRPDLSEEMRKNFLHEAKILFDEMAPTYQSKAQLTWKLSVRDAENFEKFSAQFANVAEQNTTKPSLPSAIPTKISSKGKKAEYVATLDALDYVAARLEAHPSAAEKAKYEEQGSLLKANLIELKNSKHKKLKLSPEEKQKEEQVLDRYQTAKRNYNLPASGLSI
jgi:hypothetical protein